MNATLEPQLTIGNGGGYKPPAKRTASAELPDDSEVDKVLQTFEIPPLFWRSFKQYVATGRIVGAEFRNHVRSLTNFRQCLQELRKLSCRDYPKGDGFTFESYGTN
jgi:hypothetical protein